MARVQTKKGGDARLIIERFADDDYVTIPAGYRVESIVVKKRGTTAGALEIGTAVGGAEVVTSTALGTVNGAFVQLTINAGYANYSVATKLYLDVSVPAAAGDISFQIQKVL